MSIAENEMKGIHLMIGLAMKKYDFLTYFHFDTLSSSSGLYVTLLFFYKTRIKSNVI